VTKRPHRARAVPASEHGGFDPWAGRIVRSGPGPDPEPRYVAHAGSGPGIALAFSVQVDPRLPGIALAHASDLAWFRRHAGRELRVRRPYPGELPPHLANQQDLWLLVRKMTTGHLFALIRKDLAWVSDTDPSAQSAWDHAMKDAPVNILLFTGALGDALQRCGRQPQYVVLADGRGADALKVGSVHTAESLGICP
jgi:hypothetical protein